MVGTQAPHAPRHVAITDRPMASSVPPCFVADADRVLLFLNGERTKAFAKYPLREQRVDYGNGGRAVLNAGLLDAVPRLLEELGVSEVAWRDLLAALSATFDDDFGQQIAPIVEAATLGLLPDNWMDAWSRAVEALLANFCEDGHVSAMLSLASYPVPRAEVDAVGDALIDMQSCPVVEFRRGDGVSRAALQWADVQAQRQVLAAAAAAPSRNWREAQAATFEHLACCPGVAAVGCLTNGVSDDLYEHELVR